MGAGNRPLYSSRLFNKINAASVIRNVPRMDCGNSRIQGSMKVKSNSLSYPVIPGKGKMRHCIIAGLAVFCWLTLLSGATTGKISGRITDEQTGDPLVGANVFIEDSYLGAATDAAGYYMMINVSPGSWNVRINMIGYTGYRVQNVNVRSDHTTTVNAQLQKTVLETEEAVTVTASRPVIEVDRTSTEASVSADQLELMPVQTIDDVLNLQAGVVDGHFRGGRSGEVSYIIDGVPINDVFTNKAAITVENDVIQELKVISGTFNAEYGQAQSGIVEIITKEGIRSFEGDFSVSMGDYFSGNEDEFRNIDEISAADYVEYSLTLRGPLSRQADYIVNYRTTAGDGYLYGKSLYERTVYDGDWLFADSSGVIMENSHYLYDPDAPAPDTSRFVPMADFHRETLFGKISYRPNSVNKIALNITRQTGESGKFEHQYTFIPDGNSRTYETSTISYLTWNFMPAENIYLNSSISLNEKKYDRYLFEDKYDERYATDSRLRDLNWGDTFYTGGTDMRYFQRSTQSMMTKSDLTWQASRNLELKLGGSAKWHELELDSLRLKKNSTTQFVIELPPEGSPDYQTYVRKPVEYALYAQTKIESNTLTLNAGLRFDYFRAEGEILDDLTRPYTTTRSESGDVWQLSPRFGMAYPISDKGVMHVSYGHFFQIPPFAALYANPDFQINAEAGRNEILNNPFGNADLKPQKTVAYEVGLQQQISRDISLEATAYYKDIRNLLGTEIITVASLEPNWAGLDYGRYVNRDYGQVKGFTLMLEKRMLNGAAASIDYTYQVARGNASDPKSTLLDAQGDPPNETEKQMLSLDWDQTHSLNTQISLQLAGASVLTVVGKLNGGMPYSLPLDQESIRIKNSERKPVRFQIDLFLMKDFKIYGNSARVSLKVYNVFDRLNEKDVFADSGRASYTEDYDNYMEQYGTYLADEITGHPDWYDAPRQIIAGLSIGF